MGVTLTFTATTSFVAPPTMRELPGTTPTATPTILSTAMVATAGGGVDYLTPAPETSERAHHADCAEHGREMGVNFTDSLTVCELCKINKSTKQPIHNEPGKTEITV